MKMRKIKFLSVCLSCIAVMTITFTSCNSDDDYHTLTTAEVQQAYNNVRGDYSGKLIYAATNPKNANYNTDTLAISWSIKTDSTLVIKDFPTRLLATNITNTNIKEALANADNIDLTCYTGYFQINPVAFYLNPKSPSYNLDYDGKTNKVQIAFYGNTNYSYGIADSKGKMQIQIIEGAVYENGTLVSSGLSKNTFFFLISDTKI